MEFERRCFDKVEIRASQGNDGKNEIIGYAAKFNRMSEDLGGFTEQIKPGAFKKALKTSDTRALWNHNSSYVLGRVSSETLRLKEDKQGLLYEIDSPDTQWARDLLVSIERGDVSQSSFGFRVETDKWETVEGENVRTILEVSELIDVSPVTFPAYPDTLVQSRSLVWTELGLDMDEISRVLIRIDHKLELTENDRSAIRSATEKLNAFVVINGNKDENTAPMHRVGLLRKKLELKTRTL